MRSDLWRFQAAALEELDKEGYAVPVCVTDVGQALPGFSIATLLLSLIDPIPMSAWRTFRKWTVENKLLLSFHYYAVRMQKWSSAYASVVRTSTDL